MSVPATTNRSASHRGIANKIDTATRFRNAQVIETMSRNRSFVQVYPPLVFGPVISDNYPPLEPDNHKRYKQKSASWNSSHWSDGEEDGSPKLFAGDSCAPCPSIHCWRLWTD